MMTEEKKYEKAKLNKEKHKKVKTFADFAKAGLGLCAGAFLYVAKNPDTLKNAKDSFLKK